MLDKKQFQVIFLFGFKIGHKAAETAYNINNEFGSGTANEGTVQQWFKKLCTGDESLGDESLEVESAVAQILEVDNDQLRAIIKADPLTTKWEVAKELNVDHSMIVWHLKQIGKVNKAQ